MSSGLTPGELLEIRRVKAMVSGSGGTIDPACFQGPVGPQGPTGPSGNYGTPATLGYYNTVSQTISSGSASVITWSILDTTFTQGVTGLTYSGGQFYNYSITDDILLNVTGYATFASSAVTGATVGVYGKLTGTTNYGYTQITIDPSGTVVPFTFNIYVPSASSQYFEIYAYQNSGVPLNITNSRISITRINTSIIGPTGPSGPTGAKGDTGLKGDTGATGVTEIGRAHV